MDWFVEVVLLKATIPEIHVVGMTNWKMRLATAR
jgi:hypothetical protein